MDALCKVAERVSSVKPRRCSLNAVHNRRSAICSPYPQARRAAPASTPDRVLGRMWGASLQFCIDPLRPVIQLHHRIGRPCRPKGCRLFDNAGMEETERLSHTLRDLRTRAVVSVEREAQVFPELGTIRWCATAVISPLVYATARGRRPDQRGRTAQTPTRSRATCGCSARPTGGPRW
jgi:hypothetical protein